MKHIIEVSEKTTGTDLTIKLENLSPIQMSSFHKALTHYIKFVNEHKEKYFYPEKEKELSELIIKEVDDYFKKVLQCEEIETAQTIF